MPADVIKDVAHTYARAERAQICWTLGITEHHNAVDNVLALINLALLTGHVGRYGSGLNPLRGQNNVQGGGDMGAIPNRLPGFQDLETDPEAVAKFERAWGTKLKPHYGLAHDRDVRGDGARRADDAVRARREPRAVRRRRASRQEAARRARALRRPGHLPHRDRARWRTSSCPRRPAGPRRRARSRTASGACSAAARRSTRPARRATTRRSCVDLAARLGPRVALRVARGDLERAALAGAEPRRHELRAAGGARRHPVAVLLRGQARADVPARPPVGGAPAAGRPRCSTSSRTIRRSTSSRDEFPLRLTTGRRLDSFNTGVQTGGYTLAAAPARGARAVDAPTPRSSA